METIEARELRRLAAKHAARDRADAEMARRFMLMAKGLLPRPDTRRGPGKRSCVVEMRRIEEKRAAHAERLARGRHVFGLEPRATWPGDSLGINATPLRLRHIERKSRQAGRRQAKLYPAGAAA